MIFGTCYFNTLYDAYAYYSDYGTDPDQVNNKVENGEIKIGKPPSAYLKRKGCKLKRKMFLGNDQRYYIQVGA